MIVRRARGAIRAADGPPPPDALEQPARDASRRSSRLAPGAPRGAALLAGGSEVFAGSDMTGAAGAGCRSCAEREAVYAAVMAGRRRFRALLIRGGRDGRRDGGPPCGACLQVLLEFSPGVRIWWGTPDRPRGGLTARELLPGAFRFALEPRR